jgi:hypothetical protein
MKIMKKEDIEKVKNIDIRKIRHLTVYQKVKRFRDRVLKKEVTK